MRPTVFAQPGVQSFDTRLPRVTLGYLRVELPFAEHAVIEGAELRDYLLSPIHPVGDEIVNDSTYILVANSSEK